MVYTRAYENEYTERLKTGVFYTPPYLAQDSAAWLLECLTLPASEYVFYDPAAGAGNLLDALPDGVEKWGSTLEKEDITILQSKGINAFQFDFLGDDFRGLPPRIMEASDAGRLVIFMNPPYFKIAAPDYIPLKKQYKNNDSVALFLFRLLLEIKPIAIGFWSKTDVYLSDGFSNLRSVCSTLEARHLRYPIMCNSQRFNVKGAYPIAFSVWSIYEDDTVWFGAPKTLYEGLREWVEEMRDAFAVPHYFDKIEWSFFNSGIEHPNYFDIYPKDRKEHPASSQFYTFDTASWQYDYLAYKGIKYANVTEYGKDSPKKAAKNDAQNTLF